MYFCDYLRNVFLNGFDWFITFLLSPLAFRWLPRCQCKVTQRDIHKINRCLITTKRNNAQINRSKTYHHNDVILSTIASQITSLAIVYSTVYSGADQRKHQSSASLAFVRGIHRGPVNSPHKGPVTRKMFPFDDVIMYLYSTLCPCVCWGPPIKGPVVQNAFIFHDGIVMSGPESRSAAVLPVRYECHIQQEVIFDNS